MKQTLLLATRNQGKVAELKALLSGTGIDVVDLSSYPGVEPGEENGSTFDENACAKARAAAEATGLWALADDSGLEVDALGGMPGVRSARFADPRATDEANNRLLVRRLEGVPEAERTARFVSAVAICSPAGECVVREGTCDGVIGLAPRGAGGFGYDPLFYVRGEGMTFAELPPVRKNQISHRALALMAIKPEIIARLGGRCFTCASR